MPRCTAASTAPLLPQRRARRQPIPRYRTALAIAALVPRSKDSRALAGQPRRQSSSACRPDRERPLARRRAEPPPQTHRKRAAPPPTHRTQPHRPTATSNVPTATEHRTQPPRPTATANVRPHHRHTETQPPQTQPPRKRSATTPHTEPAPTDPTATATVPTPPRSDTLLANEGATHPSRAPRRLAPAPIATAASSMVERSAASITRSPREQIRARRAVDAAIDDVAPSERLPASTPRTLPRRFPTPPVVNEPPFPPRRAYTSAAPSRTRSTHQRSRGRTRATVNSPPTDVAVDLT